MTWLLSHPCWAARAATVSLPLRVALWLLLELHTLALVEGRWWHLMASELVGTISFVPSLLPWLLLRPHLTGKGAWVRGLGCSGAFPARAQALAEGAHGAGWGGCPGHGGGRLGDEPGAVMLLNGAGSITAGTCPRQERRWAAHHEEAARDPVSLEAEDQGCHGPPFCAPPVSSRVEGGLCCPTEGLLSAKC